MSRVSILFIYILSSQFIGCDISIESNKNECSAYSEQYTLSRNDKLIKFPLDSVTPSKITYLKILSLNDTMFFTLLNQYNNTIYCYNYNNKKLEKKNRLTSERKITGYEIIDWDNIVTYQYWTNLLTHQDGKGEVLRKTYVPEKVPSYYYVPITHAPIIYQNGNLIFAGGMMSKTKPKPTSPIAAKVDFPFSKIEYLYHYPEIYYQIFFGGVHYHMDISYTYNNHQNLFVFSFPACHKIYATKDFINENIYCAGSKHINSIPEYSYKSLDKTFSFCAKNGFYYSILYDKYNYVYYRICLLPGEYDENSLYYNRDLSVIILDKELNIIGETKLINNIYFELSGIDATCVSPDGLLFKIGAGDKEENYINFLAYELIKK